MRTFYSTTSLYFNNGETLIFDNVFRAENNVRMPKNICKDFEEATIYIDWYSSKASASLDRRFAANSKSRIQSRFFSEPISYNEAKKSYYAGGTILIVPRPTPKNLAFYIEINKKNNGLFDRTIKIVKARYIDKNPSFSMTGLDFNGSHETLLSGNELKEFLFFTDKKVKMVDESVKKVLKNKLDSKNIIRHIVLSSEDKFRLVIEAKTIDKKILKPKKIPSDKKLLEGIESKNKQKLPHQEEIVVNHLENGTVEISEQISVYYVSYDMERMSVIWTKDIGKAKRFSNESFEEFQYWIHNNPHVYEAMKNFSIDGTVVVTRISKHSTNKKVENFKMPDFIKV